MKQTMTGRGKGMRAMVSKDAGGWRMADGGWRTRYPLHGDGLPRPLPSVVMVRHGRTAGAACEAARGSAGQRGAARGSAGQNAHVIVQLHGDLRGNWTVRFGREIRTGSTSAKSPRTCDDPERDGGYAGSLDLSQGWQVLTAEAWFGPESSGPGLRRVEV